jgi:hypothetical protein
MKKYFSLLFAVLLALLLSNQVASAQVAAGLPAAAGTYDWQQDVTWGLVGNWPGRNAPGGVDTAVANNPVAYIVTNVPPSNPISALIVNPGATLFLQGTGTLRIANLLRVDGNLSIGSGLTVQVDGVVEGGAQIIAQAGGTLRLTRTAPNSISSNVILNGQTANGIIEFGAGYNAGRFPFESFTNIAVLGTLVINGDMTLDGPLSTAVGGGGLDLRAGNFTVRTGQTLRLGNTGANTFIGTAGRLQAEPLGVVEINAGFNANNLPGSLFASPYTGTLRFVGATVYNLQQSMRLGPGAGGVGGVLDFATAGGAINVNAGTTLRLDAIQPNAINGPTPASAHLQTSLGGVIEVGPGFNNGVIPFVRFTAIQGTFRNLGDMQVNINAANVDPFAGSASGIWDMQGNITLVGAAGTLSLTATPVGTLAGPGRFTAQNTSQFINFGGGANGGNIPVGKFVSPYIGSLGISTSFNLQPTGGVNRLDMAEGQLSFRAANAVLTILGNTELRLGRSAAPALLGSAFPATSYIQGVSSTSQLTLGTGFNGGSLPLAATSFLPLPTSTPDGFFRGRLNLEGSLAQGAAAGTARGIVFGSSSSLVLGSAGVPANLTAIGNTAGNGITLGMTAPNSLSGLGVLQGAAQNATITLSPGFNNGVISGMNFADPYLGTLAMNGTGPMQLQDSLRIGQNGAGGQGALGLATATDVLTLRPNAFLRINGTAAADFAALGNGTALGYVQGTDTTSVLMFGTNALAGQVRGLAGPGTTPPTQFNGMLYTFGGAMSLPAAPGNTLAIGTPGGWINDAVFTAPAASSVSLRNIGSNTFRGVGTVQGGAATATFELGPGFNGGGGANPAIIPGFRFATNFAGTLVHPAALSRLQGVLQFAPVAAVPGLLTMPAGSQMTLDPAAILTIRTTALVDPINNLGATPGRIQGTDNTSIIRLGAAAGDVGAIHGSNLASPFNGRLDVGLANAVAAITLAAVAPKPLTAALTMNTGSILNLQGNTTIQGGGGAVNFALNMNQPNSFIGSATGYLTGDVAATTVTLGTGFNGGDLPGRLFGTAPALGGFTGTLRMNSGNLNLSSSLSINPTSFIRFDTGILTIADGSTLTLPGTGTNVIRTASTTTNRMDATSSAGVVRISGPNGGTGANNTIDGAFFSDPFRGRINYEAAAGTIAGNLVLGDATGTNGVLATSVALNIAAAGNLTLNNQAPQGIVLPGIAGVSGQLTAAGATSTLTLGNAAVGTQIPVSALTAALPFAGVIRTTAPTRMNLDATALPNAAFTVNHLNLGSDLLVSSGSSLGITGTLSDRRNGAAAGVASGLPSTGYIQGVDNTATVSLGGAFGASAPGAADGAVFVGAPAANNTFPRAGAINGCQFGSLASTVGFNQQGGFNGTLRTLASMTVDCRLTIGNPGGSFGILDIAAGTTLSIPPAAVSIGAALGTVGGSVNPFAFGARSLVLNNISPLATVLPTATGVINVIGDATNTMDPTPGVNNPAVQALFNGDANLGNGTLVIGPGPSGAGNGALGGTIPSTRIFTAGGFSQVGGTIISSSGTYTLDQNMSFTAAGRLILGGAAATNTVSLNGFTAFMNNTRYDAVTGGTVTVNPAQTGLANPNQLFTSRGPANYTARAAGTLLIPAGSSFGMAANFQSANNNLGGVGTFNAAVLGNTPVAGTIAASGAIIQSGAMTVSGGMNLTAATAVWRIGTTATLAFDGVSAANRGVPFGAGFIGATTGNVTIRTGALSVVAPNISRGRLVLTNAANNNIVPSARMTGVNGAAAGVGIGLAGLTTAGSPLAASIAVPVYSVTGLQPLGATVGFDGDLVIENGAFSLAAAAPGGLQIASSGGFEMNGSLIVPQNSTLALNNTAGAAASVLGLPQAASFRVRAGQTLGSGTFPTVRFDPAQAAPIAATIAIGNGFNGGQLPIMSFGVVGGTGNLTRTTANGGVYQFEGAGGGATVPASTLAMNVLPGLPAASTAVVDWGGSGTTIGSRLRMNNGLYTSIPANLQWNLNVTTAAPAGITFAGTPRSGFLGTDVTSILNLTATGAPSATDLLLNGATPALKPSIGATGFAPFNGLLRLSNSFSLAPGETVTIGTPGGLDLAPGALTIGSGGVLNLNNTGVGSMRPVVANPTPAGCTTNSPVYGVGLNSFINLGAGFNGGFVDANNFNRINCAVTPPSRTPLDATVRMAAAGNLNLRNRLVLGAGGAFDFVGTGRTFTIGTDTLESQTNSFLNGSISSYFLTNSTGVVQIGAVGSQSIPIGTTVGGTNTYAPISLNFGGAPDAFRVRVLPGPPPSVPRIGFVDLQWLVSKANTAAGGSLTTQVQWPSSLHRSGFSTNVAVVSELVGAAYANTIASPAAALPNNYFTGARTTANVPNNTVYAVFSDPTPSLTSVTNTQRPTLNNTGFVGDTVSVNGTNIANVTSVTFGGITAQIIPGSQTATGIRVRVPAGLPVGTAFNTPAGTAVTVVVTQAGGTAMLANAFTSLGNQLPSPTITSITPNPVPSGVGDVVVNIAGTNFGSLGVNAQVSTGGVPGAATVLSANPTLVSVRVPGSFLTQAGTLTITVLSSDRGPVTGSVPVAVSPGPSISAVLPSSTTANLQAFTLRVLGKNFALGSIVTYGTAQTPLTVTGLRLGGSATIPDTLLLTFPASANVTASTGDVTVRNLDGRSAAAPFTVNRAAAPVILALSPAQVAPGGPAFTLAIAGTGFQPGATVRFSDQPVTVLSNNGTEIRVVIPASLVASQGLLVVKVTNVDGQEVGARFPVTPDTTPVGPITGVNPTQFQSTANAITIAVSGSNLGNVGSATLGGTPLQVLGVSPNGLTLVIPAGTAVNNGTTPLILLLTVSNTGGNSTTTPITIFPQGTAPAITSVTPASNTRNAGTAFQLTVLGDNFRPGAVVVLNGVRSDTLRPATPATPGQLVVTVPANMGSGQYELRVVNPDTQFAAQPYGLLTPTGAPNVNPGTGITEVSVKVNNGVAMSVYPNPVLENVTVDARFEKPTTVMIRVTNVLGQDVLVPTTEQVAGGAYTKQINVSSLPAGTYTVDVNDGNNRTVKQVVKN